MRWVYDMWWLSIRYTMAYVYQMSFGKPNTLLNLRPRSKVK